MHASSHDLDLKKANWELYGEVLPKTIPNNINHEDVDSLSKFISDWISEAAVRTIQMKKKPFTNKVLPRYVLELI